ncbi:MAG: hypothetical protein JST09_05060 [Bacteroidetes bacterium]|nr:hypothetical protein [Bacteroidota bacterium]
MLTEKQIKQLKGENELLQLELEDVNQVIKQREAELEQLKNTANIARELQSKLDMNLLEIEQMQNTVGATKQESQGTLQRMIELVEELYEALKIRNQQAAILQENASLKANLLDTSNELEEASALYKKVKEQKLAISLTQSNLDIALMEIDNLKAELAELKELNQALRKKNFDF